MTNVEKVIEYLDKAQIFYVNTVDGDKPKARPFSFKMEYEVKVYFGAGTFKDVYKQMQANPNVEICASTGQNFLRYYGKAVFNPDPVVAAVALEAMPMLKNIYNEETGNILGMFYLEDATVEFRSLFQIEETFSL